MMPRSVTLFLEKACRGDVPVPDVATDEEGPSGFRDGALHLKTVDGWGTVSEGLIASLFHAVSRGEVDPASEDLARAVAFANRFVGVKCPGNFDTGRDGGPACTETLMIPGQCPSCFRPTRA